ncbi:DUF4870 domain-containing protein [Deinococcus sp. RIT780]|uniref:DUF4870 domain-containing protein n=1 Tax=Deinococcus sp. RIT780 TaxID=2870472 RepID=UPI001C8AB306|nr:DUF4870 domain-containing protein [Deinococcus sp. RIT780]MBX8467306.1 DUF4870 domain-containing protein [Deinococcus sp. RIT780]
MSRPLPVIPEPDRTPAIITHLSPLAGLLLPTLGNVLGPLVAWLAFRDRSGALDEQGKEALNFQLSFWLYGLGVGALAFLGTLGAFFLFFLPVMAVLGLVPFVFMIVAVVRVSAGQPYRYPLSIRFLR